MSKTKEMLEEYENDFRYDAEYLEYLEEQKLEQLYRRSLEEMNQQFEDKKEND